MRSRRPRFYNLKRPKIRQSWNKFNLYNLVRAKLRPGRHRRTFFQQKWTAKAMTRSYHGAHIRETDWKRMFSRRLMSSVELDPTYLATHDGSEQAAGRGSGKELAPPGEDGEGEQQVNAEQFSNIEQERKLKLFRENQPGSKPRYHHTAIRQYWEQDPHGQNLAKPVRNMTPYMQMAYAPLERRLDVAIFRALFASSTLQARQFCVHGAVTVNGKKMRYPAYRLNPGDMFQVDPERVLFATGQPKNPKEAQRLAKMLQQQEEREAARQANDEALRAAKKQKLEDKISEADGKQQDGSSEVTQAESPADTAVEAETGAETGAAEQTQGNPMGEDGEPMTAEELQAQHKSQLKTLIKDAKRLLQDKDTMGVKQKQRVRLFLSEAKRALGRMAREGSQLARAKNVEDIDIESLDPERAAADRDALMTNLTAILKGLSLDEYQKQQATEAEEKAAEEVADAERTHTAPPSFAQQVETLTPEEQKALATLLREDAENPVDESKPYLTPWQPRNYMAPFAFIPRYLEVNQNICAAVYLRHPVARRGMAEVPTPFAYETNQLAFNWYLRRS